ncbi:MAG: hypothetical protein DUD27_03930 [Lachnospiraceae bacterium]|uniref:Uncharacterized protein n=1 Tax=Candidatus Weimeria bifida TaxID=2599074 RepID=A0A6N7IZR5_9FIRM|nr:hypothetical protein [Candidatus Weimeria bifida]RRF96496.1 MAG: hypothetical protein DUD27_03930 [Lachnospiraceae bacterium]
MSRIQMKRRRKREREAASVRSLICAFAGLAGIIFLFYAIYAATVNKSLPRQVTGFSMIFFFASLIELVFGIRFAKKPGHSVSSRAWGVVLPAAALTGYLVLYLVGLYRIL